ncbi:PREDICTED: auxin-induced protein 6B-like [Tarenaya hassleriana]|uniref:auxin-induced protein 6B-like n=1 Tax=Tarenaya hassleriana TaxID=28532 RepID=UPI00053C6613|nr:PREDICTED: auxin-induced protein 6B-like [Tarenaya hassleriana]
MCKILKLFIQKLRSFWSLPRSSKRVVSIFEEEEEEDPNADPTTVPDDVKEGHVAVVAVKGGKAKRFILEVGELNKPEFLRLLEQAREEFGFQQKGPLAIPCRPEEVQKILQFHRKQSLDLER